MFVTNNSGLHTTAKKRKDSSSASPYHRSPKQMIHRLIEFVLLHISVTSGPSRVNNLKLESILQG